MAGDACTPDTTPCYFESFGGSKQVLLQIGTHSISEERNTQGKQHDRLQIIMSTTVLFNPCVLYTVALALGYTKTFQGRTTLLGCTRWPAFNRYPFNLNSLVGVCTSVRHTCDTKSPTRVSTLSTHLSTCH